MKLVIHPPIDPERLASVRAASGDMVVLNAETPDAAAEAIGDADGFYGKMTPGLLARAGRLRSIQTPTASLEHYMFPELEQHRCELTNMRGLYSDVIADHVMGYVLCFARQLHVYINNQAERRWAPVGGEDGRLDIGAGAAVTDARDRAHRRLADCTLGVVGLGQIGSEIARRGAAFGMRVVAVDAMEREAMQGVEWIGGLDRLETLLGQSDFAAIAAPHTRETEGLFDRDRIGQMRSDGYLINIGRGAIVKLDALVAALEAGQIAGAALDVFEVEPLPRDHPLWRMPNVIITPHVAGNSERIAERHLALLTDNVGRFARGEPLVNVVDKTSWF